MMGLIEGLRALGRQLAKKEVHALQGLGVLRRGASLAMLKRRMTTEAEQHGEALAADGVVSPDTLNVEK